MRFISPDEAKRSSHPAIVKMGPRIAEEGGADVPSTWARVVR